MAQIREFESTTESYFILDGVSYPKVYEAMLDNGYSDTKIKLVGTNRDTASLVFSTQYTNIRVDGDSFDTALEAISRLNQIVFSKGGGSGTGGATNVITEDSDTVAFTGNGTVDDKLTATSIATLEQARLNSNLINDNIEISDPSKGLVYHRSGATYTLSPLFISFEDENGNKSSINIGTGGGFDGLPFVVTIRNSGGDILSNIAPIVGSNEFSKQGDRKAFAQLSDVYDANSYSTDEIKTGGTWIDDKDIYTITQLTSDTPPTMETVFPTEVIGTYTVYKYTKP